jgi:hypothetical protein
MKKFKINKKIMLSFLDQYGSSDFFIEPLPNQFIIVENGNVYLEVDGKREESNNTIGSMRVYVENESLTLIGESV